MANTTTTITLDKITEKKIKDALAASDALVSTYMDKLRTANSALYLAIQDAYTLAQNHSALALIKAAKQLEIKLQTTSSKELAAARLVFRNADISKASSYAAVMMKAANLEKKSAEFAAWLEEMGGIEKVRTSDLEALAKANATDKKAAVEKATSVMKSPRSEKVVVPRPNASQATLPVHKDLKQAVWFVQETEGGFEVIAVQTGKASIDAMTKRVGEALANATNVKDFKVIVEPVKEDTKKQDEAKDRLAKG